MCQGLNSHYFHIIGDKLINPIVGVYIPIIRIPIKGGRFPIPNKTRLLTVAHIQVFFNFSLGFKPAYNPYTEPSMEVFGILALRKKTHVKKHRYVTYAQKENQP